MKKKWKKLFAAGCAISMLTTFPGMQVKADELIEDALSVATLSDEVTDIAEIQSEELLSDEGTTPDVSAEAADEEIVGAGRVTVGDRVSASFDEATGAVAFYSNNGTLHGNWVDELEVDRNDITSIEVADGTVFLPEDARGVVEDDEDWYYQFFGGLENLETFVASGFDTSYVRDMGYIVRLLPKSRKTRPERI